MKKSILFGAICLVALGSTATSATGLDELQAIVFDPDTEDLLQEGDVVTEGVMTPDGHCQIHRSIGVHVSPGAAPSHGVMVRTITSSDCHELLYDLSVLDDIDELKSENSDREWDFEHVPESECEECDEDWDDQDPPDPDDYEYEHDPHRSSTSHYMVWWSECSVWPQTGCDRDHDNRAISTLHFTYYGAVEYDDRDYACSPDRYNDWSITGQEDRGGEGGWNPSPTGSEWAYAGISCEFERPEGMWGEYSEGEVDTEVKGHGDGSYSCVGSASYHWGGPSGGPPGSYESSGTDLYCYHKDDDDRHPRG